MAAAIERLILSLKFPAAQSHVIVWKNRPLWASQTELHLDVDDPCSVAACKCTVYLRS